MPRIKSLFNKTAIACAAAFALSACAPPPPPCMTIVSSTGGRPLSGDYTGTWKGAEAYNTTCVYEGDIPPENFRLPRHLSNGGVQRNRDGGYIIRPQ